MSVLDTALRMAASAMLADKDAPLTLAQDQWLGATLLQTTFSDAERAWLIEQTVAWAEVKAPDVAIALRRALGEDLPRDPVPRTTTAPATSRIAGAVTPSERSQQVQSIADLPEETTVMTPEYERELAIVTREFERPPYWFPGKQKRLEEARALIATHKVRRLPEGSYEVEGSKGRRYAIRQGIGCACEDSTKHGESKWCKHLIAVDLAAEVQARMQPALFPAPKTIDERIAQAAPAGHQGTMTPPDVSQTIPDTQRILEAPASPQEVAIETPTVTPPQADDLKALKLTIVRQLDALGMRPKTQAGFEDAVMTQVGLILAPENFALISERLASILASRSRYAPAAIPNEYLVDIKGKQHILFAGLLAMAHDHGLMTLSADFISVTADLALARATAIFSDGRSFTEAADATPGNVGPQVKLHFARMALTRAKARCLRDALNIHKVSAEEVE